MADRQSEPRTQAEGATRSAFAEFACTVLEQKRAEEIVLLDVSGVTDLADEFLIATITSPRQASAIVDECEKERKRRKLPCIGIEGANGSSWIVLDYGDLIVHLFMPEQRAYYGLEHLWADATKAG